MSLLETSQIIFNMVVSLAVVVITVFASIIAYDVVTSIKATKKFLNNLNRESAQLYEKINNFLEGIFKLSFLSQFFKKKKK